MSTIKFDFADKTSVAFGVMRLPNRARPALVKFHGANVDVLAYFRSDAAAESFEALLDTVIEKMNKKETK